MKKLLPLFISAALGSLSTNAFADTLTEIYNQAKENDPTLLSAAATRDSAFEAVTSSRATLLPQIDLTASYDFDRGEYNDADNDKDTWTAKLGFTQELYKRSSWLTLDTAEKTARQADATYAAAQQDLILRVATAYFEVLKAQDNLAFVQAEKAAVGRQLEQTKQRFEVGLSAITDVHDAQAQYDTVLADEVLAENSLINSYEGLREITGIEHDDLNVLDIDRFSATKIQSPVDSLVKEAQEKNLNLLSSRIAQDIAKDNISLQSSGHLPSLTLDGGYTLAEQKNSTSSSSDYDSDNFNVGLNLSVPIYSGGSTTSLTKQAEFDYVAASQDLEATYRSVVKDVRAFNNNISASIGALRAYEQTVVSARSALEATEAGFDVGTRTIVDVLDSTRNLYDANKNLSNARYDYILSVLQLRQAVGTLSEQDILDINAGLKEAPANS
ncbi:MULTISPECIES: outer membrane channel protein TolC [Vibrio]|uniref:outer membrane channel protein TolC n=1 Tax=Vibrio TaxID=662 RepID=UPI002075EF43|nr:MULTISPECIES: outer membrane channel protein TolC [Vibrio]USD32023.1 outer membrane channel protein TolC [Vibrio sp. SCSIO 43186]USD45064.1 outer membrane channel protein TolC [Vibrio sp. SCSIO 43145]USD69146.1 outer membrane channel protein TolC [Vibrio sp. SCSIO 43139]USD96835.1 outer membrane channel protein TolC [Vibrio coralliilyticus]